MTSLPEIPTAPDPVEQLRHFISLPETPGFPPRMLVLSQGEAAMLLARLDGAEKARRDARAMSSAFLRALTDTRNALPPPLLLTSIAVSAPQWAQTLREWRKVIEDALALEPLKGGGA